MARTLRENALAILGSSQVEGGATALPILHFGYWRELLDKWAAEGHVTAQEAAGWHDGGAIDEAIGRRLGFDQNWFSLVGGQIALFPSFEPELIEEWPDGTYHMRNHEGVIVRQKRGVVSIPTEVEHTLVDRASFDAHYRPRLEMRPERVDAEALVAGLRARHAAGGLCGLNCGSLYGNIRNWAGVEGLAYLYADDEELYAEIIELNAEMSYRVVAACLEAIAAAGERVDFGHFWEDICFKNGPLINPELFAELVAPGYRRIADLLAAFGVDIVSLDCDGKIDLLVPIWLEHGVNTMFPIEVGTWEASIAPWREAYGPQLRGVGGTDKRVFAQSREAVDREIERLLPLIEGGGYIPCPDHRLPLEAEWDLVRYYCDTLRRRAARLFA